MVKTITLKMIGYTIKGVADLKPWGGGNACIEMKEFSVKNLKDIKKQINDNGFGVESINGAICDVYENYEGHLEFFKTMVIGKVSIKTENFYNGLNI